MDIIYSFSQCYPSEACIGEYRDCSPGYTGNYCGECEVQHYRSNNNACLACENASASIISFSIALVFVFFVVLLLLKRIGKFFATFTISVHYFQILFIYKSLLMEWSSEVLEMFNILRIFSFNVEVARLNKSTVFY